MKLVGLFNLFAATLNLYTFWFDYGSVINLSMGLVNLAIFFLIFSDSEA